MKMISKNAETIVLLCIIFYIFFSLVVLYETKINTLEFDIQKYNDDIEEKNDNYFEDEDNIYLKVTDYKSGMKTFQLEDICHGLSLQLVVYLNAALEKARKDRDKNVVPAGIFYFHIQDPFVDLMEGTSVEENLLAEFDLSGLVLGEKEIVEHLDFGEEKSLPVSYKKDGTFTAASSIATREQFQVLGDYVKRQLVTYGNEILDGNISIAPYKEEKTQKKFNFFSLRCF